MTFVVLCVCLGGVGIAIWVDVNAITAVFTTLGLATTGVGVYLFTAIRKVLYFRG